MSSTGVEIDDRHRLVGDDENILLFRTIVIYKRDDDNILLF